jgi:hypothetical protein
MQKWSAVHANILACWILSLTPLHTRDMRRRIPCVILNFRGVIL